MIEQISADLMHIFTPAGGIALLNIILIDLVMSGDNAILIGMATKNLKGEQRKKAIFWGVMGATILRIIFSVMVVWLLAIPGLQLFGAILLLYVVWKFYREIRSSHANDTHGQSESDTLWAAIKTIIIADVAMSLDNVLAVAGASHGNFTYLIIGLIISIVLMVVASGQIANLLDKYPSIQWAGLFIIFFTAIEMMETGLQTTPLAHTSLSNHLFTLLLFVIVSLFAILQTKYLDAKNDIFLEWVKNNGKILMIGFFLLLILLATSGSTIQLFLQSHHGYYYGIIIIAVLGILEILRLKK